MVVEKMGSGAGELKLSLITMMDWTSMRLYVTPQSVGLDFRLKK